MPEELATGIATGAAGGAVAGLVLWLVERIYQHELAWRERRRIFRWLDKVTSPTDAMQWRKTRAIASFVNLPEDRVRYLCSIDPRIVLSTGEKELWGIKGRARDNSTTGGVQSPPRLGPGL
jgi:hypothetical protein